MKCLGEKCKYFKNGTRDIPSHCGLVELVNNIFSFINLPDMKNIYYFSNDIGVCAFNSFDICRVNNLEWDLED